MTCRTVSGNGWTGIVCTRGREKTVLLCDGCDAKVEPALAVSPKPGVDFCPKCFYRAWRHWLTTRTTPIPADREKRRAEFRTWAAEHSDVFLMFVPLSAEGRKASAQ